MEEKMQHERNRNRENNEEQETSTENIPTEYTSQTDNTISTEDSSTVSAIQIELKYRTMNYIFESIGGHCCCHSAYHRANDIKPTTLLPNDDDYSACLAATAPAAQIRR